MPNLVGIGNSQVPTNAMLGGLAYQDSVGEIVIDKIKARTSDTAVDIFVYDTRKDSDGGAWRHRTQNTSWYNESIGEMRGARREFPAVAVIVAITNKIIIYDGDDPNLSMWMVLKKGPSLSMLYSTSSAIFNTVSALNGNVYYGMNGNGGLGKIEFINDSSFKYRPGNRSNRGRFKGRIVDRDSALGWITESNPLANEEVFSIAHTVLSNAPIDEYTGLPIPTIAVATDGGVSVIKDDGTIVDHTDSAGSPSTQITFTQDGKIAHSHEGHTGIRIDSLKSSDFSYGSNKVAKHNSEEFYINYGLIASGWSGNAPKLNEGAFSSRGQIVPVQDNILAENSDKGLNLLARDFPSSPDNNRVAYITTSYNTGYMIGDIKGAFLSDTDATNVSITGANLITNSTFANTNNWTGASNGVLTAPTGLGSYAGGTVLRITNTGGSNGRARSNSFSTTVGKQYGIRVSFTNRSSNGQYRVEVRQSGHDLVPMSGTTTAGVYNFTFTSAGTGTYILELYCLGNDGEWAEFDNVYVYELEQDRSVNQKGLQLYGTITKSAVATGAELVSYSGINGSNYLRQPYNSDLNFGTGDFSVIVWVKKNSFNTNHYIFDRATTDPFGGSGRTYFIINANGYHRYKLAGGSEQTGNAVTMPTGVFAQVAFVRRSGVMEFYLNGQLVQTITGGNASASFDGGVTNQTLTVNRYANGFDYDYTFDGMALLRISGDAPSANQMKKIYDDEKGLFHENAKCTLYGTSNDVKALAFDNTNDILHAGTSSGRSEFQGLTRINNTTTAVTTVISASNGLVAEQ